MEGETLYHAFHFSFQENFPIQKCVLSALLCIGAALLVGCSGGGSSNATGLGRAVFNLQWPAAAARSAGRAIPAGANSVKITLDNGAGTLLTQTAVRPQATVTFTGLHPAQFTASIATFASSDATGATLTTSSLPVSIAAAATTSKDIAADAAVDHLASDFTAPDILIGDTVTVTLTGRDAAGAS